MARLKAKTRNKLPAGKFALPKQRKYPIENAAHARNALARASEELNKGNLTMAQAMEIRRKARNKLGN